MKKLSESFIDDVIRRSRSSIELRAEDFEFGDTVKEFLKRNNIGDSDCRINSDYSVDFFRTITIKKDDLIDGKLPFPFGKISGDFFACDLGLSTLENSPREVSGSFVIYSNRLKDFQGGPEIVGGNFAANVNIFLKNLDGSPKSVGGDYAVRGCNHLLDVSGISPEIGGDVMLGNQVGNTYEKIAEEIRKYSNIKGEIIK